MIDLNQFRYKLQSFASEYSGYMNDFDRFWKWKLEVETENEHILDDNHRRETYYRLSRILPKWQTYRGVPRIRWRETLEDSLEEISDAYNQIRRYGLLEFSEVPNETLKLIWHGLGRVKEKGGNRNDLGCYYIISVCKPLMLLWGQTIAFDERTRVNIRADIQEHNVPRDSRWNFESWTRVMESFQEDLRQNPEIVNSFRTESLERYGSDFIVPYGRFLDIYYF